MSTALLPDPPPEPSRAATTSALPGPVARRLRALASLVRRAHAARVPF